jgi:hypothetical protein
MGEVWVGVGNGTRPREDETARQRASWNGSVAMSTVPYYAKETVGVALGRIIGFNHLDSLHISLG